VQAELLPIALSATPAATIRATVPALAVSHAHARPGLALPLLCVTADRLIIHKSGDTSVIDVAGVGRAWIAIVALRRLSGDAPSSGTYVAFRTRAAVVTLALIRCELAPNLRVARIIRALVAVVARQFARADAVAQVAVVVRSAEVIVIAQRLIDRSHASSHWIAEVLRARVVVCANLLARPHAESVLAKVKLGARIFIVALGPGQLRVDAAELPVAGILGARITIITDRCGAARTLPVQADVLGGTEISVIAGLLVVLVNTTNARVAGIICAGVPIVAVDLVAAGADSFHARGVEGAGIRVVAEEPFVVRDKRALTRSWLAVSLLAERVLALGARTEDNGLRVKRALVGPRLHVAHQRAVAQVPIIEGIDTLLVALALAAHRGPSAHSVAAFVSHCARVQIITVGFVRGVLAAARLGADVVGAGVVVLALHRVRNAGTVNTVVSNRARITVFAGAGLEDLVDAAIFPHALVVRAFVAVVAQVDIVPPHQRRLVRLPVAVVVQAVAGVLSRHRSVAVVESVLAADTFSLTCAPLVLHRAGSGKSQGDRLVSAWAHTSVSHALLRLPLAFGT